MIEEKDHREMGYGNVDARPSFEHTPGGGGGGGGESGGDIRPEPTETTHGAGSPGGQTDPAYRGGDNPNSPRKGEGSDAQ